MSELKSCPFCGDIAGVFEITPNQWYIYCDCGVKLGYYIDDDYACGGYRTEREAIEAWNTRVGGNN
jgi:hypothetical protein